MFRAPPPTLLLPRSSSKRQHHVKLQWERQLMEWMREKNYANAFLNNGRNIIRQRRIVFLISSTMTWVCRFMWRHLLFTCSSSARIWNSVRNFTFGTEIPDLHTNKIALTFSMLIVCPHIPKITVTVIVLICGIGWLLVFFCFQHSLNGHNHFTEESPFTCS